MARPSTPDAHRLRILDAARSLVLGRGPDALTAQALARSLDRSVGALYRHFPSLQSVLVALQVDAIDALTVRVVAAMDGHAPVPAIRAAVDGVVGFSADEPARFALLSSVVGYPKEFVPEDDARQVWTALRPLLDVIAGQFRAAEADGSLRPGDPGQRTAVFWAAVHGALMLGKFRRLDPDFDGPRLARAAAHALLIGFATEGTC